MDTLFYIVAKIVWFVMRPDTVILLLLVAGLFLLARGQRRWGMRLAGAGAGLLVLLAVLPLGGPLLRPLETAYPPQPEVSDIAGILVLGGAEVDDVSAHWDQPNLNEAGERYLAGLTLAHRFPDAILGFAGGSAYLAGPVVEADLARAIFTSAGIDPARLRLEGRSRNTAENAANALELLGDEAQGTWLLVTSAFHMPRAVESFCAAGWTGLVPWPVDFRTRGAARSPGWDLATNLNDLNIGAKEWVGRIAYRATGRGVPPAQAAGCLAQR
ncbi:YdcF family protein [Psychromarinibacter halotolerans]|uniref:YdcF family protein n=1 Tax=Psychromarinibacter halotolerans TaxID=1775175 RepID=A0ABV7GTD4_9RHOB|nr:YdcF family protein [Psychromarinibacter halotolerans]MDF0598258.1 YdcF family protein [Psychromarinibacter halotolerans]